MDVTTFKMPVKKAEEKLVAYRKQLKVRANAEYELAARGYRMLAKGLPLINLFDAFRQTGLGEDGRPRLAIARADRKEVFFNPMTQNGRLRFNALDDHWGEWGYLQHGGGSLLIDVGFEFPQGVKVKCGFAMVPMVPADVMPEKGALDGFFILWEVEKWADRSAFAPPPRDPYLLKHVAGDLYAVVAAWDLTDLERAVMSDVRRRK